MAASAPLNRPNLERAFAAVGDRARAAGKIVDIAVYGGAALVLTLPERVATKDLDAVIHNDPAWLREVVRQIAAENEWPADWLNDGVKGWLSHRDADPDARALFRSYPSEEKPGLRVYVAAPRYLFAMKCLAMRIGGIEGSRDLADIEALAALLHLRNADEALAIVAEFYPESRILPKTRFGIEEIFSRLAKPGTGGGER